MKTTDLLRLIDGELSPSEEKRVRAEMSDKERSLCAALEAQGAALRGALSEVAPPRSVWPALERRLTGRPVRFWRWSTVAVGAAAVAAALLLLVRPGGSGARGQAPTIEIVEFGEAGGVVYEVPELQMTVLWQATPGDEP